MLNKLFLCGECWCVHVALQGVSETTKTAVCVVVCMWLGFLELQNGIQIIESKKRMIYFESVWNFMKLFSNHVIIQSISVTVLLYKVK